MIGSIIGLVWRFIDWLVDEPPRPPKRSIVDRQLEEILLNDMTNDRIRRMEERTDGRESSPGL